MVDVLGHTLSYSTAIVLLAGLWAIYIVLQRAHVALFGPLSKIPGPKLNRWTSWPVTLANMPGKRVMYLEQLSKQYGPIVRIGPNEVAVNDVAAIKTIHKMGSSFYKTEWYELSTGEDGKPGMFAMTNPKAHGERRRLFAQQFSKKSIEEHFDRLILEKFKLATRGMQRHADNGKVDLMVWWAYLATDLIGEMTFGESFQTLERGVPSQYNTDMQQTSFIAGLRAEFPTIVRFLWNMPIPSIRAMKEASARVESMGSQAYTRFIRAEQSGSAPHTIFSDIHDKINVNLAQNEAKNLLIAGSDTTMVTLTYLIWIVLKSPSVKQQVLDEISKLEPAYTIKDAESLAYLPHVLQESLRLYGAGPGSIPRAVPAQGAKLCGYELPGGTVVTTQAYVPHRDASIFPDPLSLKPERWEQPTQAMQDAFMPFGGGSRICLGQHLARLEMLIGLIEFFKAFPKASIPAETTDESMEFENYFLIAPKSHRCLIALN